MAEFHISITGGTERWDGSLDPLGAQDLDRAAAAVRAVLAPLPQREAENMRVAHVAELTAHRPGGRSLDRAAAERWRGIVDAAELAAHRAATRGRPDPAAVYVGVRIASRDAPSAHRPRPSSAVREADRGDGATP